MAFDNRWDSALDSSYTIEPVGRRRNRWLEITLLLGFLACLLIGLGALAIFWRLYTDQTPAVQLNDPLASVQPTLITPGLALAELAGDPTEALAYQAFHAGHLETARVILTFTPAANSDSRLGLLLPLARQYLQVNDAAFATLLFYQAQALATLDDTLGSLERSQTLVQIADGLLAAGEREAALDVTIAALRVARQAPDLLPAQRSQLFTSIRPLADQLGDVTLRQQIAELVRNPFLSPTGVSLTSGQLWSQLEPIELTPEVMTAIATRQQRARELVNRIAFTGGADIGPEQAALAQALLAEDGARAQFVSSAQGAGLSPGQQLWLLLDQRAWLLLKIRIASLGFGLSLLPEWEASRASLVRELNAATGAIDNGLQTLINRESDPLTQATLHLEALHWLALQHELGYTLAGSPEQLNQRLAATQAQLTELGSPPPFPVAYEATANRPGFRLQATP
jgi:hypothetical protein